MTVIVPVVYQWVCPDCLKVWEADTAHDIGVVRTGHIAEEAALKRLEAERG